MANWQDRVDALTTVIPDPCQPIMTGSPGSADLTSRWRKQHVTRSRILGSVRQLVLEHGLDNVQITAVADRSSVSVQTIYNIVGPRDVLLGAAASEWVTALAGGGVNTAIDNASSSILMTIEMFWAAAILRWHFTENLIRGQAQSALLERPFLKATEQAVTFELEKLRTQGALAPWSSVPLVARHLSTIAHVCVRDWLISPYAENAFRQNLVVGCGLLMRGAVCGDEVTRIERVLDAA